MKVKKRMTGRLKAGLLATISIATITAAVAGWVGANEPETATSHGQIVVYKTPTCGCCNNWVAHLRDNGFEVAVVNVRDTQPIRSRYDVPRHLGSCHTAVVDDYWVEGHVPADLIRRLVVERPADIRGIAVPGMPMGSPGMEGPNPVDYDVIAAHADGSTSVFAARLGQSASR